MADGGRHDSPRVIVVAKIRTRTKHRVDAAMVFIVDYVGVCFIYCGSGNIYQWCYSCASSYRQSVFEMSDLHKLIN